MLTVKFYDFHQEKLNSLVHLSAERKIATNTLGFSDLIQKFNELKSKKKPLSYILNHVIFLIPIYIGYVEKCIINLTLCTMYMMYISKHLFKLKTVSTLRDLYSYTYILNSIVLFILIIIK